MEGVAASREGGVDRVGAAICSGSTTAVGGTDDGKSADGLPATGYFLRKIAPKSYNSDARSSSELAGLLGLGLFIPKTPSRRHAALNKFGNDQQGENAKKAARSAIKQLQFMFALRPVVRI